MEPCAAAKVCNCVCVFMYVNVCVCIHTLPAARAVCVCARACVCDREKEKERTKLWGFRTTSEGLSRFWNLFWLVPGICHMVTCLETSSWAFLIFYLMWLHRVLCIQMATRKYLIRTTSWSSLEGRGKRVVERSRACWAPAWSRKLLTLVDTCPQSQNDGFEWGPFHNQTLNYFSDVSFRIVRSCM